MPPRKTWKESAEVEPVTVNPPLRVGVEFGDAVPGSSTRTAYFGVPISAAEINDYLTPSVDSLTVPGSEGSLSTTTYIARTKHQFKGVEGKQIMSRRKPGGAIALPVLSSVPRGVNANKQMREGYVFFIMEEYQDHRIDMFFRPIVPKSAFMAQTKRPRILEFIFLGAKILEAFSGKPESVAIRSCSHWLRRYVSQVINPDEPPNPYLSTQEVEDKLNALFELEVAQSMVLGTAVGHTCFRLGLPSFLRLVSEEPDFLVEQGHSGLLYVSLPAILTSKRVEVGRFVFQDLMRSLILGLPTLVDYDSTGFPIIPGPEITTNWICSVHAVHGIPIEMLVNISEVHNWRAQRKCADWTELETRAWSWTWNQREIHSEESVEMICRLSIQEAWRHVTLIYIYMGMCEVTSDDPRVQASVSQIVKLMGVVGDSHLGVHFSILATVAGVAARRESQRALILQKLNSFSAVQVWKFRGRDMARVLKYLWHNAAADGAAIKWDEYIQARCKVLPIP